MGIRWVTAFVDMPAEKFDVGTRFWLDVTGSQLSPFRGEHSEFATVIPPNGDPSLRVQRLGAGRARIHVDLHVDSIPAATERAHRLGARLLADRGHMLMESPAGLTFCLVSHGGELVRTVPFRADLPHVLDQLSIDVPSPLYGKETRFWSDVTGWDLVPSRLDEFTSLARSPQIPYRILLQRLGTDDPDTGARAHLDIACGGRIDDVAAEHERLGAVNLGRRGYWVTMQDPAGLPYCLTPRDPVTGQPPTG